MRCDNCGWNNPDGLEKCQKCNQTLMRPQPKAEEKAFSPVTPSPFKATVVDAGKFADGHKGEKQIVNCVRCGYPLLPDTSYCPNCGSKTSAVKDDVPAVPELKKTMLDAKAFDAKRTVMDSGAAAARPEPVEKHFSLVPADCLDGKSGTLVFTGENVRIKRNDIDGGTPVSENLQALFEYADGGWHVTDKSGLRNTYVCASHRIKLEPGDIVVIGNRRFIFE